MKYNNYLQMQIRGVANQKLLLSGYFQRNLLVDRKVVNAA